MIAIIVSTKDLAGMNIKKSLVENFDFREAGTYQESPVFEFKDIRIYTIKKDTIFFEECENEIIADCYIFATRHQSKSGEKTLSVHLPGNYGNAEYGGTGKELCFSDPSLMKNAFLNMNDLGKDSGYQITLEATHHGPLIRKPVFFIEIGSKEEEWTDKIAGNIIANTIVKTLTEKNEKKYETAIGFGGSHYCSGFNKIELENDIAMGHICPKYMIDVIDEQMVRKMVNSAVRVDYALLDWKGMDASGREKIISILDKIGVKWKKTKNT